MTQAFTTILVPLDGSALAEQALVVAERLARSTSARLVLVRSAHVSAFPGVDQRDAQVVAIEEAKAYLDLQAAAFEGARLPVITAVPYGDPADEILEEIDIRGADVIVMATHGRSGLGRWVYGSVADKVLRRATVPVILTPPGSVDRNEAGPLRAILVPLDGSELAEAALGPSVDLANRLGAHIVLLQVIAFPPYALYTGVDGYVSFDAELELNNARRYLVAVANNLRGDTSRVRIRAELGQPTQVIADAATQEGAGLIAMATHGRSGLARLVLGSVATGVLRRASVPVMVVRPSSLRTDSELGEMAQHALSAT
jgi:nucleotide-binding universal stress UspA family protein